jgi:hypothetical protein
MTLAGDEEKPVHSTCFLLNNPVSGYSYITRGVGFTVSFIEWLLAVSTFIRPYLADQSVEDVARKE